ncbi:exodeoxyribonuclease III [Thermithiobacillus plumbiphilus]|uniref:Exodeoxyribonuclease III n=1 Tax=Thermithiobacillus plumbiphilus TaxID=1729899 RepID=A0ABU9D9N2_9PROT
MKIATWNVNSLKVRLPQVLDWLAAQQPDVLCLQETKLTDAQFPRAEIEAAGYQVVFSGQPAYNGVAILARAPMTELERDLLADDPQKRLLAATINGVRVVNVYVPNGQAVGSEKYAYKLAWLTALRDYLADALKQHEKLVLLGDFNIAPEDRDVHDPEGLAGQVLLSEAERAAFRELTALGLCDVFRLHHQEGGLYSWWDYRAFMFRRKLGIRIDLILASPMLAGSCSSCEVDVAPRRLERPSDHAPVWAEFVV